jgi:hypothetical protein
MESLETTVQAASELVRRFAIGYQPAPAVVLLAGSRARGISRFNSDYDVVFLYPDLPAGAWREMASYEGADLEIFAHDLRSLKYFFREIELPSGEASLACMVDEGVTVLGAGDKMESHAKKLARDLLAAGPLPLDDAALSHRRYAITDLAETLKSTDSRSKKLSTGSALYPILGSFALLANGRWTASGKALPAALRSFSHDLETEFTRAFDQFYSNGRDDLIQNLVDETLKPFGGRLRAGFRQKAPPSWR